VPGLPPGTDPCSAECAVHLATAVRSLLGTDVGIAMTGVGGPDPQDGHDPGTVYLGWATAEGASHRLLRIDGSPEDVVDETVTAAMTLLGEITDTRG
jgi:nicotinamide-nucleotide amidase